MKDNRLKSLDILRGLDMWMLVMVGPIVQTFVNCSQNPVWDGVRRQVEHVRWEGFVTWDIIMPLFLFMAGAAIPFALAKYREGAAPRKALYLKLARRVCLLFLLGWIVQGNLLDFTPRTFHPYANTLQSIAVGYLFASLAFVHFDKRGQIIFCAALFLAYFLVFLIPGHMDFDIENNIAMRIDKFVLGSHRDGVIFAEDGSWKFAPWYNYTWILSSLNFTVTVMLGMFSGEILKGAASGKKALYVAFLGAALLIASLLLSCVMPIIKKIWSSSMTLFAGGISCLLLALLYYIVDVKGWKRGINWLKYYGMNSITAYFIGEFVIFNSVSNSFLHGFGQWAGEFQPVVIAAGNAFILFFLLKYLYKKEIFLRV